MKELTIEQKAQRYDEALEKAKDFYKGYKQRDNQLYADDLESIFPELKKSEESEDERVKNFISNELACLRASDEKGSDRYEELTNAISWLEKQGEQKPSTEGVFVNVDEVREDFIKEVYSVLDADPTNDRANQIIEAFDNLPTIIIQKPVDKVEPKFKIKYAGSEYNVLEIKEIAGVTYYGIEDEPNHVDYVLLDNCEIVSEHNPTWSEEDENAIQVLKDIVKHSNEINENIYTIPLKEKLYDWLKSLKDRVQPQPRQEWDKKDKCMLNNVIDTLKPLSQTTHSGYAINSMINWLKSLRPKSQWKPSDEQMDALLVAVGDEKKLGSDAHKELYELYLQLRNLI